MADAEPAQKMDVDDGAPTKISFSMKTQVRSLVQAPARGSKDGVKASEEAEEDEDVTHFQNGLANGQVEFGSTCFYCFSIGFNVRCLMQPVLENRSPRSPSQ